MKKTIIILSIVTLLMVTTVSCKKSTAADAPVALTASIMVNGIDMTNGTLSNPSHGDNMRIRVQFSDPQGNHTIRSATASTSHGGGMMSHMGDITLYDDGSHGDDMAGDGWFYMEDDMEDMMAFMGHDWNQIMGEHEYEIYCVDEDGNESNHISIHMTIQN